MAVAFTEEFKTRVENFFEAEGENQLNIAKRVLESGNVEYLEKMLNYRANAEINPNTAVEGLYSNKAEPLLILANEATRVSKARLLYNLCAKQPEKQVALSIG